jgi:hypothetical protein
LEAWSEILNKTLRVVQFSLAQAVAPGEAERIERWRRSQQLPLRERSHQRLVELGAEVFYRRFAVGAREQQRRQQRRGAGLESGRRLPCNAAKMCA